MYVFEGSEGKKSCAFNLVGTTFENRTFPRLYIQKYNFFKTLFQNMVWTCSNIHIYPLNVFILQKAQKILKTSFVLEQFDFLQTKLVKKRGSSK